MPGFIDLHCHWIEGIDDGARSKEEGLEMLRRLGALGFEHVVGTPHMRPALFDNSAGDIRAAYRGMEEALADATDLPTVSLSSEHYFDESVYERILSGNALPYPGGRAILLEFYDMHFADAIERRLFELQRRGILPVLAHPERYRVFWKAPERLERLVALGSVALLDAAALVGKYGRRARHCAESLLERGLYHAACSDAHRPADLDELEKAFDWLEQRYDRDEVEFLFDEGPRKILAGERPE